MPERSVTAQPGRAPSAPRTAGTLFAALYGELVPHAWRGPEPEHDAYSLFYQRSLAMGWLDDTATGAVRADGTENQTLGAPGLWAMNDAGWDHPLAAAGTDLISWFQVEASSVAADRPLPVQPFLRCAQDATARAGTPHLRAIQVLLPVHGIDASSRPPYATVPSLRALGWFAERDPRSRTSVQISINSGQDPAIPALAAQLTEHLTHLDQDVFACNSHDIDGQENAGLPPPFHDSFWNGPPRHGVVLHGDLTEWSCDVVGWLAEVIADCAAQLGVHRPLLLTATRALSTG